MAAAFFVCRQMGLEVTSAGASASTVVVSSSGIEVSAWWNSERIGISSGVRHVEARYVPPEMSALTNDDKRGFGIAGLFLGARYSAQT